MQENYYAELAKAVYAAGSKEHWTQEKINDMLRNPQKFEKYYENKVNVGMSKDAPITPVVERMMADQQKRMSQKQEVEASKQREQETLDEATMPSPSGKVKGSRTVKKFMNDQAKFEERRSMKLEELKHQEESNYDSLFRYSASNKSKMILEKKKQEAVQEEQEEEEELVPHERLYASTKEVAAIKEQSRIMKPVQKADFSHQPQINKKSQNMAREVNIVDLLGHDAERRQKRKADAEGVKARVEKSQMQTQTNSSSKSQDMVYQRYARDKEQVFQNHEIDEEANTMIDFPTMLEIIGELGFIKGSGLPAEVGLCTQMWHHIGGNEKQSDNVKAQYLEVFLLAIQNFQQDWFINTNEKQTDHEKYGSLVSDEEDDENNNEEEDNSAKTYQLTVNEILAVKNHFHQFSMNRQDFIMETKKQHYQQKKAVPDHSYAPQTNSKSNKMQDGKREASTHDQLFARQKEYEERRRQKAELKEEMETADVRDKPSRDTAIPKHIQDKLAEKQSGNIHARLYDDAEKNQAKQERTGEDANIEREPDEYTFTPKINAPLPPREERQGPLSHTQQPKGSSPSPKKNFSSSARAPKPNKIEDKLTKQLEDQSPQNSDEEDDDVQSLTVKIALGGKEHEIHLYKDSDPEQIGREFAKTQNLPANKAEMLIKQLKQNQLEGFPEEN